MIWIWLYIFVANRLPVNVGGFLCSIIKNKYTILMKMRKEFAQVEINSYLCTRKQIQL